MSINTSAYTGTRSGLVPLAIGIIGPSGTGKSTLAKKIARMITRSEHSPNVLLVDGDIFGRSLTSQIELSGEIHSKHLHDVIVGNNSAMSPVELPESCIGPGEWPSLAEDGRVFFVPSSRKGAERLFESVSDINVVELKKLLTEAINSAASSGRAEAVVIDTAPTPGPCGAIFASMCDLIILIGGKDHDEQAIKEHLGRLEGILRTADARLNHIPVEIVFNYVDPKLANAPAGHFPVNSHLLPAVDGLGDEIADSVDFERRVAGIVSPFFIRAHPGLVPSWCAPLPGEWRKIALALGESQTDSRPLHLFPRIARPFLKRAAFALAIGIPALACVFLSFSIPNTNLASAESNSRYVGLAIGISFLLFAIFHLLSVSVECKACLEVASRLAAKDLDWILKRLRHQAEHNYKSHPERMRKLRGQKLNTLHRVFDTLGRSIRESGNSR